MKNSYKLGLAAIAASIALVGCGSDSTSTPTVTGQFVDTYVSGLNYACSSGATGITNNMGEYTCNEGDRVEFSLGGYILGTAAASSGIVTPEDIQPDNPDAALNVAQLLQTLDTDPTDNIITIAENFTALDDVNITLDDANFDDLMETELEIALVTEEEAQTHLDEAELMVLLAGNTFYNVGSDNTGDNWIDSIVFNTDATSLTWTSLTNSTESGTHSVVIEGDKIILDGDDGLFELIFVEEAADKLVFHGLDTSGAVVEEDFMFFDQVKAEAYYDSLQSEPVQPTTISVTQSMLDGKTFYHYQPRTQYEDEIYSKMTLSGGVMTRTEVINGAADTPFEIPYTIIEGKVRINVPAMDGDPATYIWWTLGEETVEYWIVKDEEDQNQDGSIEATDYLTLYLSKPTDYPASL